MDFSFDVGVSDRCFNQKPKKFCGYKFNKTTLTIPEFAFLISHGHVFAHNYCSSSTYSVHQKRIENFDYTNIASIDFDDSTINFDEAYNICKIKPSIAYTTMSNSDTNNRYRFVYVFNETVESNDDYRNRIITLLNLSFDIDVLNVFTSTKTVDSSCFNVAQQFTGTVIDKQLIVNPDNIISIDLLNRMHHEDFTTYHDFYDKYVINDLTAMKCPTKSINNKERKGDTIANYSTHGTTPIDITKALEIVESESFRPAYNNFKDANVSWGEDEEYHFVGDQDVYTQRLYFKGGKVKIKKRNRTLFFQTMVLRNIDPDMTKEDMLANLIWITRKFYEDYWDFSSNDLAKIVEGSFKYERDLKAGKIKYIFNPHLEVHLNKKEKLQALGKARTKQQDLYILDYFDFNKSIKENACLMKRSSKTISNSLRRNGMSLTRIEKSNDAFKRFKEIYYLTPEDDRKVRKLAEQSGLGRGTTHRYIQRIKIGE